MRTTFSFFYKNGLSLVFLLFMIFSLSGQIYTGWREHNEFLATYNVTPLTCWQYLLSGHFLQATFENWESEFLQMALFVIFTIFLRQQGSSESKKCGDKNFDKEDLVPESHSPWSLKKGGIYLAVYKHSLSISLILLFFISFILHWYGSWLDFNEQQFLEHKAGESFSFRSSPSSFYPFISGSMDHPNPNLLMPLIRKQGKIDHEASLSDL